VKCGGEEKKKGASLKVTPRKNGNREGSDLERPNIMRRRSGGKEIRGNNAESQVVQG